MGNSGVVYWVELSSALAATGLNVSVGIPQPNGAWAGSINDVFFVMSVAPKDGQDGLRDMMIITLCGQDEKEVVPKLAEFMGYQPFCKYRDGRLPAPASATFEWDRKDPAKRFAELEDDRNILELQRLEEGFTVPAKPGPEKFYQSFTSESLKSWEDAVDKDPKAEWNGQLIAKLLPFLEKVMPLVGKTQSLFGLSLISLDSRQAEEGEIVKHGLQPLLKADVITAAEAEEILRWFAVTEPTWSSGGYPRFRKEIELEGVKYSLWTDSYRNFRCLNLGVEG